MKAPKNAMKKLNEELGKEQQRNPITFDKYLEEAASEPKIMLRNIFQLFSDFIHHYIEGGIDEYPDDPESINFVAYDCSNLLVEGTDNPFFADRLFANKLMDLADSLRRGAQQNKAYLFEGPHGSGKSTFLNNLFLKLEEYTRIPEGATYETMWILDKEKLGWQPQELEDILKAGSGKKRKNKNNNNKYLEVPCPSHDYPILMVPKEHRKVFLEDLIKDEEFKDRLFNDKEYDWVFKRNACTICTSMYYALLEKLNSPEEVFKMLFVRKNFFNRRLGEGVTVYNSSDPPPRNCVVTNEAIQRQLGELFGDSNKVKYVFSKYAKTNNGIYSLMDIKEYNVKRLTGLHGIISEGVHKVDDLEENIDSLLIAVINPEDRVETNDEKMKAFSDRLEYRRLPYVQAYDTEVEIFKSIFGSKIEEKFLPSVLNNFAKVIISSRLQRDSPSLKEWIKNPVKYVDYCPPDLLLLKMDLYIGHIPQWLTEEDRKRFTAQRRRNILKESENEGFEGISGRKSIDLFDEFYLKYSKGNELINMNMLETFFSKVANGGKLIPQGFLQSLVTLYDYNLVQEIKDCLYYYNDDKLSRDIQNYLYAVNFDVRGTKTGPSEKVKCPWTGELLDLTEDLLTKFELSILGKDAHATERYIFRKDVINDYVTKTLTQEIQIEGKHITETELYESLFNKYTYNIKENVLAPFIDNDNFRNAIKDYKTKEFRTYDTRIREDIKYLISNLKEKYGYTEDGAKQVCIYSIDKGLAKKF